LLELGAAPGRFAEESDCLDSGQVDAGKHYAPVAKSVGPCAN
jgi:hypothetical protein